MARLARVVQVFTPSAPIDDLTLFAGRFDQLVSVLSAVSQRGQHAVIYGERGVGKTSLANIIDQATARSGESRRVARINVTSNDNFQSLLRTALRRLGHVDLEEHEITPAQVIESLASEETPPIIVIDELDRLQDDDAISLIADTIKALSDQMISATLVLVGVGDTVADLIDDHRSVERALVQIQMPRMSRQELAEAIDKGLARLDMTIDAPARGRITRLSEGLPSVTHLLAQHAALSAIRDDRMTIEDRDVDAATRVAVRKAQQSILTDYQTAIRSPRQDNLFAEALLSCALAPKDDLGWFTPGSVRAPMSRILDRSVGVGAFMRHINEFATASHGAILERGGSPRRFVFRFRNPMMQPYVILRGIAEARISEATLLEFRPEDGAEQDVPPGL